jgi:phage FluMu gp28-like protein
MKFMASRRNNPAQAHTGTAAGAVALYAYQRAWVTDESRFKLAVKARQIGWTFATALRTVRRRLSKGGMSVWVSASERQSREAIEYINLHLAALKEAFDYEEIEFPDTDEKALAVTLKHNSARVIAMPANPNTMRGFAGDVVLDEFAFHRDAVKIWRAALAIASRGYQVEVISTPNGQQGKFWELCRKAGVPALGGAEKTHWTSGQWSVHAVEIHAAVAQGCPIDPQAMREAADDEDTWLQEYCCTFLADAENYIPMELVVACESEQATLDLPADFRPQGPLYLGVDIGRRKDRTVIWLAEKLGDVLWTRRVDILERAPFATQFSLIDSMMREVARNCQDATGLGMQLAEQLQTKWGSKVEAVTFDIKNKERMATLTKSAFEERKVRIPASANLRRAINAVKRFTSPTGHFRFDADRTDAGHADEFWALALCLAAAQGPAISTEYRVARGALGAQAAGFSGGYAGAGSASRMAKGY